MGAYADQGWADAGWADAGWADRSGAPGGGTCVTWSQTSDKAITGLCSMELLMETVSNMRNGCPICATPVVTDDPDDEP